MHTYVNFDHRWDEGISTFEVSRTYSSIKSSQIKNIFQQIINLFQLNHQNSPTHSMTSIN